MFTVNKNEVIVFFLSQTIMNILHIDDSQEICQLYSEMFAAKKQPITNIKNGKEGLDLVIKNDYDIILLDMYMPKYSGIQFLHDLKNKRPSELKKVIVLSMLDFNENQVNEFLKMGIHSVELKPTNFQNLERIMKNMYSKKLTKTQKVSLT